MTGAPRDGIDCKRESGSLSANGIESFIQLIIVEVVVQFGYTNGSTGHFSPFASKQEPS
ncbi:hypothetical protein C942_01671 [Photobacterium marinum]|uniref:Uncharacterized protein n=1 Tax=Photobacterium marinum TaxID=1056511 RepID=L8JC17_9GAMM|nr:hypothetical protein C942_01671 [Photobacterium marinum]